jgi:membrane-bound lytic murein transglycosylase F
MLLLSKPEYAKKARQGYCRCEEPVRHVREIQTRYGSYAKLVALK